MFKRNEGTLDRILRVILGIVLLPTGLFLLGGLQGSIPGVVIAVLGGIGLLTGFTGFCLLYVPFGINTLEKEQELIEGFKSKAGDMMERCMTMMAGYRQVQADGGIPGAEGPCGPCPPSLGETPDQQV